MVGSSVLFSSGMYPRWGPGDSSNGLLQVGIPQRACASHNFQYPCAGLYLEVVSPKMPSSQDEVIWVREDAPNPVTGILTRSGMFRLRHRKKVHAMRSQDGNWKVEV